MTVDGMGKHREQMSQSPHKALRRWEDLRCGYMVFLSQELANFVFKVQIVNISASACHIDSITTTQFCHQHKSSHRQSIKLNVAMFQ